jgi:hypothetical protein
MPSPVPCAYSPFGENAAAVVTPTAVSLTTAAVKLAP